MNVSLPGRPTCRAYMFFYQLAYSITNLLNLNVTSCKCTCIPRRCIPSDIIESILRGIPYRYVKTATSTGRLFMTLYHRYCFRPRLLWQLCWCLVDTSAYMYVCMWWMGPPSYSDDIHNTMSNGRFPINPCSLSNCHNISMWLKWPDENQIKVYKNAWSY